MSQDDIYILLKNKRLSGDNKYYSAREIQKMIKEKGTNLGLTSIHNGLLKLRVFGFLDSKIVGKKRSNRVTYPLVVYRLKQEYLT